MKRRTIVLSILGLVTAALSPFVAIGTAAMLPPGVELGARTRSWLVDADYLGTSGVRLQRNRSDCGVAALEMLVEHAGGDPTRLAPWHEIVAARHGGMSMLEMRRAAKALGVRTHGVRANLRGLRHLTLPAIVHFDNHFAVLDRITPTGYELRDPANGRIHMSPAAFADAYTGQALALVGLGEGSPVWTPESGPTTPGGR